MRSSLISLFAILFAATVSARWGWGACPTIPNSIAYDSMMDFTSFDHKIIYADAYVNGVLNWARSFSSSIPQIECLNLGNYAYGDEGYYNMFTSSSNPLRFNVLYWDGNYQYEVWFTCLDLNRAY